MTTVKTKAKRKISKFNFEAEGSAVALVSASQGGAANSFKTLVIKSADKFSKEFIQKAQKVQVVMEFDDFLQKFFDMWKEDAKILTSILGFGDEGMDSESELDDLGVYNDDYFNEWFDEKLAEEGATYRSPTEEDKLAWLEYRKQGITLVKSLAETDNKVEQILANAMERTKKLIIENKGMLAAITDKLIEGETITHAQMNQMFIENGYTVYLPFGTAAKNDMIIEKDNIIKRQFIYLCVLEIIYK